MANDPAIDAVFAALTEVRQIQRDTRADVRRIREQIMALSEAQQTAFDTLTTEISDLSDSVDRVLEAAQHTSDALTAQIDSLNELVVQLQADDDADANTIAALQQQVLDLQAIQDAADTDVVDALTAVTDRLEGIDSKVDAVNS